MSSSNLKRNYSDLSQSNSCTDEDDTKIRIIQLASQNKSLVREIKTQKRKLLSTQNDLDELKTKSKEMDCLVSTISRHWAQVENDIRMIVDSFSDENATTSSSDYETNQQQSSSNFSSATNQTAIYEGKSIFSNFLQSCTQLNRFDPTDVVAPPSLRLDDWSSVEDAAVEAAVAHTKIDTMNGDNSLLFGPTVTNEALSPIVRRTSHYLQQLVDALSQKSNFSLSEELSSRWLRLATDHKSWQLERGILVDRITQLAHDIVDLKLVVFKTNIEKRKIERSLNKSLDGQPELTRSTQSFTSEINGVDMEFSTISSSAVIASTSTEITSIFQRHHENLPTTPSFSSSIASLSHALSNGTVNSGQAIDESDIRQMLAVLESQLAESESSREALERQLNERVTSQCASSNKETLNTELEETLTEQRLTLQKYFDAFNTEANELRDRIAAFELALASVEANAKVKCEQLVETTEDLIRAAREEKEEAQKQLVAAKAELAYVNQLKEQVRSLENLVADYADRNAKLQAKIAKLLSQKNKLTETLAQSRKREEELSTSLAIALNPEGTLANAALGPNHEEGEILNTEQEQWQKIINAAETRCTELLSELNEAKTSISDLLLEIDDISVSGGASREQSTKLLNDVTELREKQAVVLADNIRLQDQLAELVRQNNEARFKVQESDSFVRKQDLIINQLRQIEKSLQIEIDVISTKHTQSIQKISSLELQLSETQLKVKASENKLSDEKSKTEDFERRLDTLTQTLTTERKTRQELQRDLKKKEIIITKLEKRGVVAKDSSSTEVALQNSLGILRCSICRDRFKSRVLMRCMHMFCKQCLDHLFAIRSRKCPECTTKFDKSDISKKVHMGYDNQDDDGLDNFGSAK